MRGWDLKRIDALGKVVTGKTPSSDYPDEFGFEYPFITPSDIPNTQKFIRIERFLSEKGMEAHKRIQLPPKATCVVCIGATIGKTCMTAVPSFSNQQINTIIANQESDADFVYYIATTLRDALVAFAGGAATPIVNKSAFSSIKVLVPNYKVQRKIAAVLSAYDDLIENNNRRIAILEKMAEELYREWFVRLRFPGHEKVRIVKGVPEGWEVKRIGDLVEHQIGGGWGQETPSGSENMPVYIIRGTDFKAIEKGNFTTAPLRFEKRSSIISRALKHGDIILENSVNAQSRCTGNTILITEQMLKQFDHPVMPASFCKLIRFKDVNLSFYIWKHMRCYYEQGAMEYFQNVATNGIANFQMARFLERFIVKIPLDINLANSLWSFDCSKHKAILQTLTISRDMLLSRLMSGKIDVERLDIKFPASMMEESVNA